LVAAEITLLSGGLGRVMQYLGRAFKKFGFNIVFIEPHYLRKIIRIPQDQLKDYEDRLRDDPDNYKYIGSVDGIVSIEIPLDYKNLPLPLDPVRAPELDFYVYIQGHNEENKVKVFVYNQQVTDSLTESFISLARTNGIPVVGVYETMPEPGYHYQSWMLAEVQDLQKAVADHVSSEHL